MTTYFVTRHKGAVEWARRQGISATMVEHLDPNSIVRGDMVLGTLPIQLAAEVIARGGRYLHLELTMPPGMRGTELTADDMVRHGAKLQRYHVVILEGHEK
jgi:CRISPR-associated protein Csx16